MLHSYYITQQVDKKNKKINWCYFVLSGSEQIFCTQWAAKMQVPGFKNSILPSIGSTKNENKLKKVFPNNAFPFDFSVFWQWCYRFTCVYLNIIDPRFLCLLPGCHNVNGPFFWKEGPTFWSFFPYMIFTPLDLFSQNQANPPEAFPPSKNQKGAK